MKDTPLLRCPPLTPPPLTPPLNLTLLNLTPFSTSPQPPLNPRKRSPRTSFVTAVAAVFGGEGEADSEHREQRRVSVPAPLSFALQKNMNL